MKEDKHIVQLDGLRFFAVLMVMIAHWLQWRFVKPVVKEFPFVHGVTLFFVLSGFLITRILIENREKAAALGRGNGGILKSFYIRRALRILPIYYLTIFILLYIDYPGIHTYFPWLASFTINIQESVTQVYPGDYSHFWSLGVEEQFYLLWPWVMLFVPQKKLLPVIVLTIVTALGIKTYFTFYSENWMANAYLPFTCMHALGLGALLAYLAVYRKDLYEKAGDFVPVYVAVLFYLLVYLLTYKHGWAWHKTLTDEFLFAATAFFVIARAAQNRFTFVAKRILEDKFVAYSGKISYGLYVCHLFMIPLLYYLAPLIGLYIENMYTQFVTVYFFAFVFAHVSWTLIEKPLGRLKKYFPYIGSESQHNKQATAVEQAAVKE